MSILNFPWWKQRDNSVQQSPPEQFTPSPAVIRAYANDIEKYGHPLDSGMTSYFRKCAEHYETKDTTHD